ncbi:MAG: hypothetical protein NTZ49_02850 [Candidatus Parcubacteria bacterium]|nr:hypothetical protein [Candidatus Parcubacteria bacterium]
MSQPGSTSAKKDPLGSVRKKIDEQKEQMRQSGRYYFICEICGKKGPKFAIIYPASGKIEIFLGDPRLKKWPIMVVAATGKHKGKILSASKFGYRAVGFTTVRICPGCARKNN